MLNVFAKGACGKTFEMKACYKIIALSYMIKACFSSSSCSSPYMRFPDHSLTLDAPQSLIKSVFNLNFEQRAKRTKTNQWLLPTEGRLSSPFGYRNLMSKKLWLHKGLDIAAKQVFKIYAIRKGSFCRKTQQLAIWSSSITMNTLTIMHTATNSRSNPAKSNPQDTYCNGGHNRTLHGDTCSKNWKDGKAINPLPLISDIIPLPKKYLKRTTSK